MPPGKAVTSAASAPAITAELQPNSTRIQVPSASAINFFIIPQIPFLFFGKASLPCKTCKAGSLGPPPAADCFRRAQRLCLGMPVSAKGNCVRDINLPGERHPEKAHRPDQAQPKKPDWIRVKAPTSEGYKRTRDILREKKLVTVCEEAGCPNVGECWSQGHATMMIMGDICTRGCSFCNIATGKPRALDLFEPGRVAHAVAELGLKHVVVTSVDRDDLDDGGAEHFAMTIRAIRRHAPGTTIEVLTPDFLKCGPEALEKVVEARPDVFNHNLETVPGLYPEVRPGARYFHSLRLLQRIKELDATLFTKSGIMVGLGEDGMGVRQVMDDMRSADVDFLTIGQYLQPSPKHHRVDRFVTPEEFAGYEAAAWGKGFLMVSATPLTRSSYHAGDDFARLRQNRLDKLGRV